MTTANVPSDLRNVQVATIRANPVALRGVDRENEKYLSLRDDIAHKGVMSPIQVREKTDPPGADGSPGADFFEVTDGLQRFSCASDLGLITIPVNVINASDAEVLENQITANLCRVDTPLTKYADQLRRMFAMNPTLTLADMAEKVSQSPAWVNQRLGLLKLDEAIQPLVDDGKINIANAYTLSKLPKEEQSNFVDAAITMPTNEFVATVNARAKELRDAAKQGREASAPKFEPVPHMRKLGELKAEFTTPEAYVAVIAQTGAKTPAAGFAAGVAWALSLDPASTAASEAKYNARQQKLADEKAKRDLERAEKKAQEAAEEAAKVKAAQATAAGTAS